MCKHIVHYFGVSTLLIDKISFIVTTSYMLKRGCIVSTSCIAYIISRVADITVEVIAMNDTYEERLQAIRQDLEGETPTNIYTDLGKNIIAVWHDESHLNRYFVDHKPTVILSPSYCYPESWKLPYKKRLLALDKNHAAIRS